MKGYFKKDFIRRLVDDADIVGIINQYVPLTRSGNRYKARCPFHTEKTPSFIVTPDMNRYHCFGCGANGDVLDFLMEINKLDFSSAVEMLADLEGVNVQYEENGNYTRSSENSISYNQKQELYNCIKDTANYFYKNNLQYLLYNYKVPVFDYSLWNFHCFLYNCRFLHIEHLHLPNRLTFQLQKRNPVY